MNIGRLSILGVGLLGGSIGLAIKPIAKSAKIIGYGHRRASLDQAIALGAIHEATTSPPDAVKGADLVVLCTPVGSFEQILKEIAPVLKKGAIVTDVGSTKRSVVNLAEKILPSFTHFVGSHPMAGSEKRGVDFARADLFRGGTCILTPTDQTDAAALESIENFWRELGMKTLCLSPEDHDRQLAEVSHLPHAVAAALVAIQQDPSLALAGKGFWDTTRIASGDAGLWRDIFLDNRDNLKSSIEKLQTELTRLQKLLDPAQTEALRAWLDTIATRRTTLFQKNKNAGE